MLRLILTRLAAAVPILFTVVALSFLLTRLAPGGPFDAERALDPAIQANLRRLYHLDRPLLEQFGFYLWNLLHGDLGPSTHWRDFTINDLFAKALPISIQLGTEALALALVLGTAIGAAGARSRRGAAAFAARGVSVLGLALPVFVTAPLLQLCFALDLHWLPAGGWGDGALTHQILPVLSLSLPQIAIVARLTETAMRDALEAPHIRTLRAFGLPGWHIAAHALRGALLPVVSYLGPAAAALLTGSIVVETIFGIPGIGRYFVDGALSRDYTLVMATVIVVGAMVVTFNLFVDMAYGWIDPRVRDA
jgi:oligopeptide transport system permease protein